MLSLFLFLWNFLAVVESIILKQRSPISRTPTPSCVYLFQISNGVIEVVLVSLLLTLNRFNTLFYCFFCWLWTIKCPWDPDEWYLVRCLVSRHAHFPASINFFFLEPWKILSNGASTVYLWREAFSFRNTTKNSRSLETSKSVHIFLYWLRKFSYFCCLQRRFQDLVKHLWWIVFPKIVND